MATEFRVVIQDRPGTLARLGGVLGEAGVNIEAIQGTSREGKSFIQFVPNDPEKTGQALDVTGIPYTKREVLIVRVLDEPGMLGDVALVMSKAGINIDSVYVFFGHRRVPQCRHLHHCFILVGRLGTPGESF